jgi:hypothetical protein
MLKLVYSRSSAESCSEMPVPGEPISSIWRQFGLRDSPFSLTTFSLHAESSRSRNLFVGRQGELQELTSRITQTTRSVTVLQGGLGVGKTSFMDILKARVSEAGILWHGRAPRISPDMSCLQLASELPVARLFHESDRLAVRERRVLVHVDATEMKSTSHAAALVEQFRDYVLTEHTHWVFERYTGKAAEMFSGGEQVNGVVPSVMTLAPLPEGRSSGHRWKWAMRSGSTSDSTVICSASSAIWAKP